MPKTDHAEPAKREPFVLVRRDVLRGAAAAGFAAVGAIVQSTPGHAVIWEEGEEQCHASTTEKDPPYDIDDALLADFMAVSRTLTGMALSSVSDIRLGLAYLGRYSRIDVAGIDLRALISAHADSAEAIMNNGALRPAAEQLIYLWYLSAFLLPTKSGPAWIYGTTDQYERGLLWAIIGAHAPMMPMHGGKKNYWADEGRPLHLPAAQKRT